MLITAMLVIEIAGRLTSPPYLVMALLYTNFLVLSGLSLRRLTWSGPEGQQLQPPPYLTVFFFLLAPAVCVGFIRVVPMLVAAAFFITSSMQFYLALGAAFRKPADFQENPATDSFVLTLFKPLILPLIIIAFLLGSFWLFTYKKRDTLCMKPLQPPTSTT